MTEVPEHLLRRSRERRAAATGEGAPAAEAGAAASGAVEPAAAAAPATAAGSGGTVAPAGRAAAPAPEYTGPPPPPPRRQRIPLWALPVLVALPLWAILYSGAFGEKKVVNANDPVVIGQGVFASAGCSGCHGPTGGGGVGPALDNVTKTFPKFEDQIAWVENGSANVKGQTYGNSGRVATGGMPGFKGTLTPAQITAVVCHERVDYAKESPVPPQCQAGAAGAAAAAGGATK